MPTTAIKALGDLLARPEGSWSLSDGAVAIARLHRPDLDPAQVAARLDALGARARAAVGLAVHPRFVAAAVGKVLFGDAGFRTPAPGEETPDSLQLDAVLETHVGAPTALAVVFIETARRCGSRFDIIALPGAPLLRRDYKGVVHLFDPASARPVTVEDCRRIAASTRGRTEFREGWLRPITTTQVLARLLAGLKALHWRDAEHEPALIATRLLLAIRPDDPREIRDCGRLLFLLGRHREAIESFEAYLAHNPDGEDADAVRMLLIEARAGLSLRA
jgi:regulator of sirC expression with transglutaminase-like and TPR domain